MNHQKKYDIEGVSLLIVDHNPSDLRSLSSEFANFGLKIYLATSVARAREIITEKQIHVVLAEYDLGEGKGLDLLEDYKKVQPEGLFFLIADKPTVASALKSIKSGATDYLEKPVDIQNIAEKIEESLQARSTHLTTVDPLIENLHPHFLFRSSIMRNTLAILPRVAATMQSILITGETGTGKEIISRVIHSSSPLANGPFVAVNCGAIPEGLIEGELFGHEKGAFTGAVSTRKGKFELAQNGTLLLDEIGEMPLAMQVRLLRVLEEGAIYRVGGEKPIPVRVRILAATRVNLEESVKNGLFREDLYYRLNVFRLHLPQLKERLEDIPLFAWSFLSRAFDESNRKKPYPYLAPETIQLLKNQIWKGNVRELRNVMTRIAILLPDDAKVILPMHVLPHLSTEFISKADILDEEKQAGIFVPIGTTMEDAESKLIQATLESTGGNRTHAAKKLGIGLRTLRRKLNTP